MSYRNNRPSVRPTEPEEQAAPAQPVQVSQPAPQAAPAAPVAKARRSHDKKPKSSRLPLIIASVVIIAIILLAGWFFFGRSAGIAGAVDGSKYQAVFFTNGQVYFGKLSSVNDDYMRLKNVYYLQNKSDTDDDSSPQSTKKQDNSDMELIKLGNEVHGPEDEMIIAKDQILFFENLKQEGTVSKTIAEFVAKNKQ